MVDCPKCRKQATKPDKAWKYSVYTVQAYTCKNCSTQFREYLKNGKHIFTLKFQKGKGFVKV